MSTSANVTYYNVYKNGKFVAEHRQNHYCKQRIKEQLKQHLPVENFTLIARWPDEDEVDHFSESMPLKDYLDGKKLKWKNYYEN